MTTIILILISLLTLGIMLKQSAKKNKAIPGDKKYISKDITPGGEAL